MKRALEQIAVAGRGRFAVFVSGEEGVEKELVAKLIHQASEWATGEFFALDASLVPETLLGRELLGCEEGAIASLPAAFDGALRRVAGGTVLLDHIASVPKELQQALAFALEEGRFRRIGGSELHPLECRLIASSTESLEALTASGRLLPELSERLRLLEISIPPLRERKEDILPMAAQVLSSAREESERELGRPSQVRGFAREALERLREHNWPGNERELREQIQAAMRLVRGEELGPEDLLLGLESTEEIPSFRDAKRAFEREYVTRVLRLCKGNISRAARIAKKDRKDFYDVMRRNSINPQEFRL
ncbi:MAG: sigma-54-dependent Fis family transcriptional regulator [bacterium]|nr:sigma-54-dependent Fis family transcriptional regulator [bacterium]